MATDWHYNSNGREAGPVSAKQLKQLAASGALRPDDLVRKEGMSGWTHAKSVKGLFTTTVAASSDEPPPLPPRRSPPAVPEQRLPPSFPPSLGSKPAVESVGEIQVASPQPVESKPKSKPKSKPTVASVGGIEVATRKGPTTRRPRRKQKFPFGWIAVAAGLLVVVTGGIWCWQQPESGGSSEQASSQNHVTGDASGAVASAEKETSSLRVDASSVSTLPDSISTPHSAGEVSTPSITGPISTANEVASDPTVVATVFRDKPGGYPLYSNGSIGSVNSKTRWHVQDGVLFQVFPNSNAPYGKWVDTGFLNSAGNNYKAENQNGTRTSGRIGEASEWWTQNHQAAPCPDVSPSDVVARISHVPPNSGRSYELSLMASGRIGSANGKRKWAVVDDMLILIHTDRVTWIDTCKINPDGTFNGKNQNGATTKGRLIETTEHWDKLRERTRR